jgi:uncharacterized protein (DUF1810 family)
MAESLERFVTAQEGVYDRAVEEIRCGRKRTHWIWFIFPQLSGLGKSDAAQHYGIRDLAEAKEYLAHRTLGPRLQECVLAALGVQDPSASSLFGELDAMKFRSSMTLFARATDQNSLFKEALARFFGGQEDCVTVQMLEGQR